MRGPARDEPGRGRKGDGLARPASVAQFVASAEVIEGFGIGQGLDVLHRALVHDVAHRQFDDLARLGAGNIKDLDDAGGHMAGRGVVADRPADAGDQRVVEPFGPDHLDAELHQWAAQVDAMLVETPADRAERIAQVADLMAESIAARPVLCDLISAQSAVLERNISTEVAMQHKYAIGGEVQTVVRAMVRAVPELSEAQAWQVLAYTILLTAGAWPQSRPAPAIQAAYDLEPDLAAGQMDFTETLRDLIRVTITGLLASA